MKKILALILAILMLIVPLVACDKTPDDTQEGSDIESETVALKYPPVDPSNATLFVGYAREDITPPEEMIPGLSLAGYSEGRPIEEIRDHIYVSCTAFRDAEGDTALIYTLDLHSMTPAQASAFCSAITKATKVQKSNVILNVTHNHAAPHLYVTSYEKFVSDAVVRAAEAAIADLKACTVMFGGEVNMKYFSFVRRYHTENGDLYGVGHYGDDKIIAHESEGDPMIPVARFVRDGGKDVILVNFAAHCDTVKSFGSPNTLAADYVANFRRIVEEELDCHFSMQLGATADLNPMTSLENEPHFYGSGTSEYGRNLAYKVLEELKTLPQLEIKGDVEAVKSDVKVTVNHSTDDLFDEAQEIWNAFEGAEDKTEAKELMKKYGIATEYEAMFITVRYGKGAVERRNISAISIGNIVFAAADYEMFSKTGRTVKDAGNEKFDLTFMCPYSNGMESYIATDEAFDNGGYEVYSTVYERGSAEKIADGIIELINKLAE